MIYRFSGNLHLWSWQEFKEEINGDIVDYEVNGNIIKSLTFKTAMKTEEVLKIAKDYELELC